VATDCAQLVAIRAAEKFVNGTQNCELDLLARYFSSDPYFRDRLQ